MADVLLIEPCNFEDCPAGGQLSFVRQMIKAFGSRLALVGFSTDDTPVGSWTVRTLDGVPFDYYAYRRVRKEYAKPLVPWRLTDYVALRSHRERIMSKGVRSVFVQAHQTLLCIKDWRWDSICYCFPGLENPLRISRYWWASALASPFHHMFLNALCTADVLLAAADDAAIERFADHTRQRIKRERIIPFPTRVDTSIFRPANRAEARRRLDVPLDTCVIATSGRLHWAKGWPLLLDCFSLLVKEIGQAYFVFIGDGEDRYKLEERARELGLDRRVKVTGHVSPQEVSQYLNGADIYVMGSRVEGWPTAMVEALATGKPVVSTDVSGARSMVEDGKNGYVVRSRRPEEFCDAVVKALALRDASSCSLQKARRFSLETMADELSALWAPLRREAK